MKGKLVLIFVFLLAVYALPALSQEVAEIRTYEVKKLSGNPPVIDGEWTEEEWAGSEWSGDFYGTRHSFNNASLWGEVLDIGYQWRALWDDEQIYFLITTPMLYINKNGWVWSGDMVDILEADDVGYASWNNGQCLNIEFFLSPNWPELYDWGAENAVGQDPPNYHFGYFPLLEDVEGETVYALSNFGVRGAEGPPFFFTDSDLPGDWAPITDPAAAEEAGVLPFQLAALPHLIEGAVEGEEVVGIPALELAIPYTALSFTAFADVEVVEDIPDIGLEPLLMLPDENGNYVQVGDEWLFNWTCYVDGARLDTQGLGLANWNDMGDGGFHNAPRGIIKFIEEQPTVVKSWMIY